MFAEPGLRQDVSRSDPASGAGGYQSQGGNTCSRPEGPRPLPMSPSVGSSPAGVHGGLLQPWLMRKHRRLPLQEAKHILIGGGVPGVGAHCPCQWPAGPWGGGAQGQSLSCPLSRKRPSSVNRNKQPSPHLQVKARKNLQRAHTCWAKRVLVWGEMGRPRGGGHYALRGRWGALGLDAGPLGYPPGWRGTAWLS